MAVTGNGTQGDPWIVHNYDEIKDVMARTKIGKYLRLANDIDCNDYGAEFEWSAPEIVTNDGGTFYFDLGGFAIKNVKVAANSSLFKYYRSNGTNNSIYNGALLNVFLPNAVGFVNIANDTSVTIKCTLQDLSISIDGTTATGIIFEDCKLTRCAVWFQSGKLLNDVFRVYNNGSIGDRDAINDCDFYFDIQDMNGKSIFYGIDNNSYYQLSECRLDGKVGGLPVQAGMLWNVPQRHLLGMYVKIVSTCVNINSLDCPLDGGTDTGSLVAICASIDNLGNAVNKSITHPTYTNTAAFNVDSTGIVTGNTLRAAGFVVSNVVGG